jgi:putative transposase
MTAERRRTSLSKTPREEVAAPYEDFADARRQLGRFLDNVYNTKWIPSSLGYLTPAEF